MWCTDLTDTAEVRVTWENNAAVMSLIMYLICGSKDSRLFPVAELAEHSTQRQGHGFDSQGTHTLISIKSLLQVTLNSSVCQM